VESDDGSEAEHIYKLVGTDALEILLSSIPRQPVVH